MRRLRIPLENALKLWKTQTVKIPFLECKLIFTANKILIQEIRRLVVKKLIHFKRCLTRANNS